MWAPEPSPAPKLFVQDRAFNGDFQMKKTMGAVLVVLGLIVMVWGFLGFKTRETVVDVGPIHATRDKTHNVPYGPIAGAVVLLGGVVLIATGRGD